MNERNYNAVPKSACMLAGGLVEFGDNGKGAKSAPIRLKARSGDAIDHWYWGKIIHDFAGMRIHKPRLTVDYAHNDDEVLGYLNHFDVSGGELIASGALTPWREDDRASEVMWKMQQGVPYEASIFFGGDGIRIQEIEDGEVTEVNGRQFAGPGLVVREWPLRGVAICPYGADAGTEARSFAAGETVAVQKVTNEKGTEMKQENEAVDAEALVEGSAPVEASAVDAEAEGSKQEVSLSETVDDAASKAVELTAERDALKAVNETLTGDVTGLTAERDGLAAKLATVEAELTALKADRDEACRKLKAIEAGSPPVSATSAQEGKTESAWKKAQAAAPHKRK